MLGKYYWLMFDHHVANSPYTAGELLPASQGHKVHRWLHVLPMGVDTDGLDPQKRSAAARLELSARAGISPDQKLVTYIGRLAPEKNLPLLLDMLEALPKQFHLIIAGDGELRPWLVEQAEQRTPGRLHLLGHLQNRASLAEVHAGADVCVHPNHREPFGIAPLEAMAAGVPLVAPVSGGVRSYADETNSWLAEDNGASYASAVLSISPESTDTQERLRAARETALAHSWPAVSARFFRLYDDIMTGVPFPVETALTPLVLPRRLQPKPSWQIDPSESA
ncbi:MAG: glycosyltransferase [Bryobacteraceae bacterium]|nr:glycosyltransferase [Bryobacteraceae bacterium]